MYGFLGCYGNRLFQHYYFCPIICCPVYVPQRQPQIQAEEQQAAAPYRKGRG